MNLVVRTFGGLLRGLTHLVKRLTHTRCHQRTLKSVSEPVETYALVRDRRFELIGRMNNVLG